MGKIKWAAIPVVATTLLLVAVAAVLLRGADNSTARQATPEQAARQEPSAAQQVSKAPAKQAAPAAPRTGVITQPNRTVASRPATKSQAASAKVASTGPANDLGWRLGTEWTVQVEEYADYLAQPQAVTVTYRYKVVAVDAGKKSFSVSQRFADPANQPEAARGDLMRAGYTTERGALKLAWVQPQGKGAKLRPAQAHTLLGNNSISLEVAASPFSDGKDVSVLAAGLGKVRGNRVVLGKDKTATYVKGAPWWVSYSQGRTIKAKLTSFKR